MPGLLSSLYSGTKALGVHSKGLETAGKNLANINNAAYARQRVILADRGSIPTQNGVQSMGVEAMGLRQARDPFLDRQVLRETGFGAGLSAKEHILQAAEAALGQQINRLDDSTSVEDSAQSLGGGISEAMGDFFNAFESLSSKPTDIGEKQLLLQKAEILAEKFNSADTRLAQVQTDVDAQISADVGTVNNLLDEVARLNQQIGRAENGYPNSAVDLRDQRQAKLEELAQYFDFEARPIPDSNGQIQIIARDTANAETVLVDRSQVTGPIAFDGTNFTGGTPAVALAFSSGSLTAQRQTRDGAVQAARDGLKNLADQLTAAVNTAYNPTSATGNFFSATPGGLLAIETGLTAASIKTTDTGNAGANELAQAVAAVAGTRFSTGAGALINGTLGEFFSSTVSSLGQELASTTTRLEDQQLTHNLVLQRRDSVSGVSQDEELTDLIRFQRSFQASARFVTAVDELLDLVVNRLGV